MSTKIALIDDNALFRESMRTLLLRLDASVKVAEYSGVPPEDVTRRSDRLAATDLVLLDYHLPNTNFIDNLSSGRAAFAHSKIVVISADETATHIVEAIQNGAAGFIPKSSLPAVFIAALKLVVLGQTYLPEQVLSLATHDRLALRRGFNKLSASQKRVLTHVVAGKSNKVIAIEQGLALGTVKQHLSSAYAALGINNRTQAVMALSSTISAVNLNTRNG